MSGEDKEKTRKIELKFDYRSSRLFALLLPAIYLVALSVFCIMYSIIPGPELIILAFLIYAAYNKRTWSFLKDWLPLLTLYFSYEIMYGFVGTVSQYNLHQDPLNLELNLFGQIPSVVFQQIWRLPVLNYMGAFFYSLHFIAPTLFAFILWKVSPKNYWKYTIAFGICAYGALMTFLFYPVAPPWIELPNVTRILIGSVDASLGIPVYKTLFDFLSPNLYAAFPSMHSALPLLIALFSIKIWRVKGFPILIFPIDVWFSAVYLGKHYVVDVFGGIANALVAYVAVDRILLFLSKRFNILAKYLPQLEVVN